MKVWTKRTSLTVRVPSNLKVPLNPDLKLVRHGNTCSSTLGCGYDGRTECRPIGAKSAKFIHNLVHEHSSETFMTDRFSDGASCIEQRPFKIQASTKRRERPDLLPSAARPVAYPQPSKASRLNQIQKANELMRDSRAKALTGSGSGSAGAPAEKVPGKPTGRTSGSGSGSALAPADKRVLNTNAAPQEPSKVRVSLQDEESEEVLKTWNQGPQVELGPEEGAHWRWCLYPNILISEQYQIPNSYGLIIWNGTCHELLEKRTGQNTITFKDIMKVHFLEDSVKGYLCQSWILPYVSSVQ